MTITKVPAAEFIVNMLKELKSEVAMLNMLTSKPERPVSVHEWEEKAAVPVGGRELNLLAKLLKNNSVPAKS